MSAKRGQNSWSRVPWSVRKRIKSVLIARDGLTCCVCKRPIPSIKAATIEHKRERGEGGAVLDLDNLGLAHGSCNYGRHGARSRGRITVVQGMGFFE